MLNPKVLRRLHDLGASHTTFMRFLAARVSNDALVYIAGLDHGFDRERNLDALRHIQAGGVMPVGPPKTWIPREVIEVFRWYEFGDPSVGDFPDSSVDFHIARAFGCAAWLESYTITDRLDLFDGPNTSVVLLLYSLEEAGPQFEQAAPPFFAWLLTKLTPDHDEHAFFILALVWTLIRAPHDGDTPDFLLDLIDWLHQEEADTRARRGGIDNVESRWLLGTTVFDQRHSYWAGLSDGLNAAASKTADAALAARLLDIGQRLSA